MRLALIFIALSAALAAAVAFAAEDDATIAWRPNLEAALAEASQSGRPLMVVFR